MDLLAKLVGLQIIERSLISFVFAKNIIITLMVKLLVFNAYITALLAHKVIGVLLVIALNSEKLIRLRTYVSVLRAITIQI
jgi:hypothetical protein